MGKLVGDGQCVALAHAVVTIPSTHAWQRGAKVRGNNAIARGTIIATFDASGRYANHLGGNSHPAIYLGQDGAGLRVADQWIDSSPQPAHERPIRFRNGKGMKADDGDQYYVVQ